MLSVRDTGLPAGDRGCWQHMCTACAFEEGHLHAQVSPRKLSTSISTPQRQRMANSKAAALARKQQTSGPAVPTPALLVTSARATACTNRCLC